MLDALGPVNYESIDREQGQYGTLEHLGGAAYVGYRCRGKHVFLVSKSQSAVTVISPYVNDALRIESN